MKITREQFNVWLDTFIEEKELDLEAMFEVEGEWGENLMPYQVVIDAIKQTSVEEQKKIKNIIVAIDFRNGDVLHFFRHLGKALAI